MFLQQLPKRFLDISLAAVGGLFLLPVCAILAVLIKVEDGGPIFYAQMRAGKGGRPFRGWKFRSMVVNADQIYGAVQASENDHRVTRIGRLMRATAMDEIPQLWNIFKGDMSFVGPRALRPEEFEIRAGRRVALSDIEGYAERHSIVPGLTGLAQVYAERDIPARSKFRFDRLYLRRRGFWFDLKLIAVSVWITLRGKWEKRGSKL
jgi:lipopolysaccharide/colanic/teichoic acid biosynthesis glycosyltransferase